MPRNIQYGCVTKRIIFLLFFFFTTIQTDLFGQINCLDSTRMEKYKNKTRNIIGLAPSNARVTNGWAIGWSTSLDCYCAYMDSIRINGLHTNISPFQIGVAGMTIAMTPFALFSSETYKKNEYFWVYDSTKINNQLNGISIGLFELTDNFCMQGLQVTALYTHMGKINGFSITLGASDYQYLNGFMISGVFNKTKKGKGLQMGLINVAKEMQGIQIGLWNKIGRRGFPIINMCFKNNKNSETIQ